MALCPANFLRTFEEDCLIRIIGTSAMHLTFIWKDAKIAMFSASHFRFTSRAAEIAENYLEHP